MGGMVLGALLTAMIGQESASTECRRDGTTIQVNACVLDDLALEEARMEAYLAAARSRALDRDRASETYGGEASQQSAYLDASQSAWEAYAAIRCGGVYDQWRQGTIRTVMSVGCQLEATRLRTHDIWTDHLTFMDSTPPVMPEPLGPAPQTLPEPQWP